MPSTRLGSFAALSTALALLTGTTACGCAERSGGFRLAAPVPAGDAGFASALYQLTGAHLSPGHQVSVVHNGAVFDAIEAGVAVAKTSVHLVVYIWEPGRVSARMTRALVAKARTGVECRVLVDDHGSPDVEDAFAELQAAGCEARRFRPGRGRNPTLRNHRKIVIVDGAVAVTGGFSVADTWLGNGRSEQEWREISTRFEGPAVAQAQQAFAENWVEAGGAFLPAAAFAPVVDAAPGGARAAFVSSTAAPTGTRADRLTQMLVASATKRLWITNAYFAPTGVVSEQLQARARTGVDVRVLTGGSKSDSKSSFTVQQTVYGDLIDAGVKVYEYQPGPLHAKAMVIDDDRSLIGSVNLDPLSLTTLEEGTLVIVDTNVNRQLADAFIDDLTYAKQQQR